MKTLLKILLLVLPFSLTFGSVYHVFCNCPLNGKYQESCNCPDSTPLTGDIGKIPVKPGFFFDLTKIYGDCTQTKYGKLIAYGFSMDREEDSACIKCADWSHERLNEDLTECWNLCTKTHYVTITKLKCTVY